MNKYLRKDSMEEIKKRAEEKRNKSLALLAELMSDSRYVEFKDTFVNYERELMDDLKKLQPDSIEKYQQTISILLTELRIIGMILNVEKGAKK